MAEPVLTQARPTAHRSAIGGIRYSPASPHSEELAKWETKPLADGSVTQEMIDAARYAGVHHGAFEHQEYPKAMLLYGQTPNGIQQIDNQTAHSEVEERNLMSRGFRMRADEAMACVTKQNDEMAALAAAREYQDRRMSATARAEAERIDLSTARHLAEIPAERVAPKKRGRKPKAAPAVTEG
jgi:hypothetical protein